MEQKEQKGQEKQLGQKQEQTEQHLREEGFCSTPSTNIQLQFLKPLLSDTAMVLLLTTSLSSTCRYKAEAGAGAGAKRAGVKRAGVEA